MVPGSGDKYTNNNGLYFEQHLSTLRSFVHPRTSSDDDSE